MFWKMKISPKNLGQYSRLSNLHIALLNRICKSTAPLIVETYCCTRHDVFVLCELLLEISEKQLLFWHKNVTSRLTSMEFLRKFRRRLLSYIWQGFEIGQRTSVLLVFLRLVLYIFCVFMRRGIIRTTELLYDECFNQNGSLSFPKHTELFVATFTHIVRSNVFYEKK